MGVCAGVGVFAFVLAFVCLYMHLCACTCICVLVLPQPCYKYCVVLQVGGMGFDVRTAAAAKLMALQDMHAGRLVVAMTEMCGAAEVCRCCVSHVVCMSLSALVQVCG